MIPVLRLGVVQDRLPTKKPFVIATGTLTHHDALVLRLQHGAREGFGEAAPSLRVCGETADGVLAFWAAVRDEVAAWEPVGWRAALDALAARAVGNPAAKAALDMALLDLAGQQQRKPVHALLGLKAAEKPSSATVVLDAPEAMAREAVRHAEQGFQHLKLKLGEPKRDAARVKAVRDAVPHATLRCDANTGWTEAQARRLLAALERAEVELLEQPVPRPFRAAMKRLAKQADFPLLADEACLGLEDVERLAEERFADGFVLKLAKCGGLWQAKRMLDVARRAHLEVMVGCMVESSVGITAAAHLLGRVRWADLDGAWLLAQDPWEGAALRVGRIAPPTAPGLGVRRRAA